MFLDEPSLEELNVSCENIGVCIMRLREAMKLRGKLYFRISPKTHRLQHLPLYAEVLNPKWVQNYMEESLMGAVARVYQRAMRGVYYQDIQANILVRRTLGLLLRLLLGSA